MDQQTPPAVQSTDVLGRHHKISHKKMLTILILVGVASFLSGVVCVITVLHPFSAVKILLITKMPLGRDEAISLVQKLSEVKQWTTTLSASSSTTKGTPLFTAELKIDDKGGEYWIVHVFENLGDHIATFNWYKVDRMTKKVEKTLQ